MSIKKGAGVGEDDDILHFASVVTNHIRGNEAHAGGGNFGRRRRRPQADLRV